MICVTKTKKNNSRTRISIKKKSSGSGSKQKNFIMIRIAIKIRTRIHNTRGQGTMARFGGSIMASFDDLMRCCGFEDRVHQEQGPTCPRSLVHFYVTTHSTCMDKISWISTSSTCCWCLPCCHLKKCYEWLMKLGPKYVNRLRSNHYR